MYGHNVLKAILIPLATLLGIIGAIMILYGGITMFKQDGNKVRAQGLVNELALYTDCSYRADLISNMTAGGGAGRDIALVPGEGGPGAGPGGSETGGATGGSTPPGGGVTGGAETSGNVTETKRPGGMTMEFRNAVMDYCDAQNRPYMYLFALTGSMVFLSTLLSLCMAWRSPKSVLNWWNVHNAVTLALLFMSIYGMMQASRSLYRVHNCEGYDAHTMRQMKRAGMACYGTTGGDSVAAYLYNHVLPIFWVGVALSLASIFLNTLLTSGLWHFKDYYYGEEERRPAAYGEPVYHQRGASFEREPAPVRRPSSSTVPGPTVVSTTGATREPYFYSEEERRRAQPPAV